MSLVLSQAHCGVIRPGSFVPPSPSLPTIATAQAWAVTRNTLEAVKIQELGTWGKLGACLVALGPDQSLELLPLLSTSLQGSLTPCPSSFFRNSLGAIRA